MSAKTKIALLVVVLLLVLGALAAAMQAVMVVSSLSLNQARLRQQNNPCGPAGSQLVAATGGPVQLPVTATFTPTSEYGVRVHPVLGQAKMHHGLDLATQPAYGPIVAVKDGVIDQVGSGGAAGNWVRIEHGAGLSTRYLHLSKVAASQGQQVKVGQQIGTEGNTGRSTGPHLHLEVKQGEQLLNPRTWLAQHGVALPATKKQGNAATINAAVPAPTDPPTTPNAGTVNAAHPQASPPTGAAPTARIAGYSGEQLRNAAAIIKAGQDLGADPHTLAIGVMTAIGESTLIVIDHGDAAGPDSRGLFQQRDNGAWGSYADRMNPHRSAQNFYRALIAVPGYRELPPTLAAHRTQANQDPNHYAPYWPAAVQIVSEVTDDPSLMSSLTADGGSVPCAPGTTDGQQIERGSLPSAPGTACAPTSNLAEHGLQPPTLRLFRCGAAAFPQVKTFTGVGDRPGHSDHPAGFAVDFMITDHRTAQGRADGWQVATWMREHADELNIRHIIWDMKSWSAERDSQGWRPYTRYGPNPDDNLGHRNHVHVSMNH